MSLRLDGIDPSGRIEKEIERIDAIYRHRVLEQRVRQVALLGRKCQPRMMYTFLGFELKLGRKRVTCPDVSTARYLMIFAEIGLERVQIPYDPSQTARLLPELESCFAEVKALLLKVSPDSKRHQILARRVYAILRKRFQGAEQGRADGYSLTDP